MSAASPNNYIAIIDDDGAIRTALGRALRMENYEVELFEDGLSALKAIQLRAPNAIILDLQLPDIDGLEVCRRIRKAGDATPILMLTARDAVNDRVEGLDAGADDYLVKPFDLAELLARLRALLRRHGAGDGLADVMRFEDLTLNPQTREVFSGDRAVDLTKIEFDLLELFLQHPRQVLTANKFSTSFGATTLIRERTLLLSTLATFAANLKVTTKQSVLSKLCVASDTHFAPRDIS